MIALVNRVLRCVAPAGVLCLVAAGCSGRSIGADVDAGPICATPALACTSDRTCPGGFCEKADGDVAGCCVVCNDCSGNPEVFCDPLGASTGSRDCQAGQLCVVANGKDECLATAPPASSCTLLSDGSVATSGVALPLEALAVDELGRNVAYAQPSFRAAGDNVAIDERGALTASCPGPEECTVQVTAVVAGASCSGVVRIEPVDATKVRVAVVDEKHAPLAGAEVDAFVDGAFVVVNADQAGIALVDGAPSFVTIRAEAHRFVTIFEPSHVVVVIAPSTPDAALASGVAGSVDFSRIHSTGDLRVGVVGTSFPSLLDFNLDAVFGVPHDVHVDIAGLTPAGGVDDALPSTFEIELGDHAIQGDYLALGDGASVWSFGGEIALADAAPMFAGNAGLTMTSLVRGVGAFTRAFDSGVETGLMLQPTARPPDDAPNAAWGFVDADAQPNTLPFDTVPIHVGPLPPATTDVLAAALARGPVPSLVPVGATNVLDANGSGRVDDFALDFAPPHDGLEGNAVVLVVAYWSADLLAPGASYPGAASIVIARYRRDAGVDASVPLSPPAATFDTTTLAFTATSEDSRAALSRVVFAGAGGEGEVWSAGDPAFALTDLTPDEAGLDRVDSARVFSLAFADARFAPLQSTAPIDDALADVAVAAPVP